MVSWRVKEGDRGPPQIPARKPSLGAAGFDARTAVAVGLLMGIPRSSCGADWGGFLRLGPQPPSLCRHPPGNPPHSHSAGPESQAEARAKLISDITLKCLHF